MLGAGSSSARPVPPAAATPPGHAQQTAGWAGNSTAAAESPDRPTRWRDAGEVIDAAPSDEST